MGYIIQRLLFAFDFIINIMNFEFNLILYKMPRTTSQCHDVKNI